MYNPDVQPTYSFEAAARVLGLKRARALWAYYDVKWQQQEQEADALEACMARDAAKKKYVWNDELDGVPQWRMAPHTYVKLHRSSLNQKGCTGGEYMQDEDYMRFFLKRNEACRVRVVSPHIRSGWTPEMDRMAKAKAEGEAERKAKQGAIITE